MNRLYFVKEEKMVRNKSFDDDMSNYAYDREDEEEESDDELLSEWYTEVSDKDEAEKKSDDSDSDGADHDKEDKDKEDE